MEIRSHRPTKLEDLSDADYGNRAAFDAEKRARERITDAKKKTEEAEREARTRVDQIQDEYARQTEASAARNAESYENQQMKGYQAVRELQQRQQAELARIRRQGEKDLEDLKLRYKGEIARVERDGNEQFDELQKSNLNKFELESSRGTQERDLLAREQELQMATAKEIFEYKKNNIEKRQEEELSKASQGVEEEQKRLGDHFTERLDFIRNQYEDTLARTSLATKRDLYDLQLSNRERLAAYSSRSADPFYAMRVLDSDFFETDGAYVVKVRAPEHEASKLGATIQGHRLVISGQRRNSETVEEGPGKQHSTHSFQSYQETFPLREPVDPKGLYKSYEDGVYTVILPKVTRETSFADIEAPMKRKPTASEASMKIQKPQYPRTLAPTEKDRREAIESLSGDERELAEAREAQNQAAKRLASRPLT